MFVIKINFIILKEFYQFDIHASKLLKRFPRHLIKTKTQEETSFKLVTALI